MYFRRAVLQNQDILSSSPISSIFLNDFWGTPLTHSGSHKSYRPLTTLTFKLNNILSSIEWEDGKQDMISSIKCYTISNII